MNKSKPLNNSDQSGFDFIKEMLHGDPTFAINFDRIQWDSKLKKYVIIELLLCEESQIVTPFTSHPNRYFKKNAQKFISLWEIAQLLEARLYLINYAKSGTPHENKILIMKVIKVDNSDKDCPVETLDTKMTREEFSNSFRAFNLRGQR